MVAFCDVESGAGRGGNKKKNSTGFGAAAEKWPDAKRYADWREMLEKEGKWLEQLRRYKMRIDERLASLAGA